MKALRVLIADDEPGMRKGAAKALRRFRLDMPEIETNIGFDTVEAADGHETLARLEQDKFDLVLLDYKMPGPGGLEILEQIREKKLDLLAVMVTAYASLEVAVSATKNGAFDFLAKPFSPTELKSVVEKAARSLLAHREAQRLAREKRQVRFQFISVLAHELKAPLAAVDNYLRLMQKHILGDDISSYDQIVDRSLLRLEGMRKMILDLLDLTRIESGSRNRRLSSVRLHEVAGQSIETVAGLAAEKAVQISLECPADLQMLADRGELEIIFNNLVSNAVKYNRDEGRVDVTVSRRQQQVRIEVADTGIGMTPEEQQSLFGEFVRIKNDQTRLISGSGLGLSILKRLAALYGGQVIVQSSKDVGSTFTVILKEIPDDSGKDIIHD